MNIFFDTEFSDLGVDPRLISIGLVSEDEREFYAELADTYHSKDCGAFALEAVLPQLEAGTALIPLSELAQRLGGWILSFAQPVTLATDSLSWDWPWILEIFETPGTWPENLDKKPFLLVQTTEFNLAVEGAFATGLRRHHALDDAKANRLAWMETRL